MILYLKFKRKNIRFFSVVILRDMVFSYISVYAFIISFAIGLFFVYILGADIKKVHIYPSPENVNKILYKDNADNCFQFIPNQIECPKDRSKISDVLIQ